MNGYDVLSQAYRKAADEGKITKEQADKNCRIFDFLATCDRDDICLLFDSGAFNGIYNAYTNAVTDGLTAAGRINDIQALAFKTDAALLLTQQKSGDIWKN